MINRKYGSKKIAMRGCLKSILKRQQRMDGMVLRAVDGSDIHLMNGVVCYQYNFYDCHSLEMKSFFDSLLRDDGINPSLKDITDSEELVVIDADLITSHHGKLNMYDYISYFDELMNQLIKLSDVKKSSLSKDFWDAWIIMNDLQCYLDDVIRTQSYNASQVLGHQISSAFFATIYEYAQSGIAISESPYWDICLPDLEAFVITFADHAGSIMRTTLYGDEYVIA